MKPHNFSPFCLAASILSLTAGVKSSHDPFFACSCHETGSAGGLTSGCGTSASGREGQCSRRARRGRQPKREAGPLDSESSTVLPYAAGGAGARDIVRGVPGADDSPSGRLDPAMGSMGEGDENSAGRGGGGKGVDGKYIDDPGVEMLGVALRAKGVRGEYSGPIGAGPLKNGRGE
eukprot:CAMPEP_0174340976 /NCGR_PEP_ID=MMETSP0810-20121108/25034_1 /TAXON_ID=73025 ORGANISM="Eutreptiella gymnastica-like, Strain CCMP1594" /NCGR_SAMPLE_ID=MMETSP0810 /ASSEMBLY_ACC=CAM_ASM_000659 /LENGTH=175 /DNA_ID=CAMNT_0015462319 /DNA_START=1059 /DNA_END=1587 /DNA_ORIENTATION=+